MPVVTAAAQAIVRRAMAEGPTPQSRTPRPAGSKRRGRRRTRFGGNASRKPSERGEGLGGASGRFARSVSPVVKNV